MKKTLVLLAILIALVATACDQNKADPAIGTWKLSTMQGAPASLLPGIAWTVNIKSDYSFSWDMTLPVLGSSSATGTWSTKNSTDYVLTRSDDGSSYTFTLSDGKTVLSTTNDLTGACTFTK